MKDDKYYLPVDWPESEKQELESHCLQSFERYHKSLERLTPILGRKRAKESSRFYLPYANQLQFDVMFNFRSFIHFQNLRNKPDAQLEIKEIAETMRVMVVNTGQFMHSLAAFNLLV